MFIEVRSFLLPTGLCSLDGGLTFPLFVKTRGDGGTFATKGLRTCQGGGVLGVRGMWGRTDGG